MNVTRDRDQARATARKKEEKEHEETNSRSAFNNEKCIESNLKKFVINCRVICNGIYLDFTIVHATSSVWLNRSEIKEEKKMLTKNQNDKRQTTFAIWNDNSHHSLNQCLSEWSLGLSHSLAFVRTVYAKHRNQKFCLSLIFFLLFRRQFCHFVTVSPFFSRLKMKCHLNFSV